MTAKEKWAKFGKALMVKKTVPLYTFLITAVVCFLLGAKLF